MVWFKKTQLFFALQPLNQPLNTKVAKNEGRRAKNEGKMLKFESLFLGF